MPLLTYINIISYFFIKIKSYFLFGAIYEVRTRDFALARRYVTTTPILHVVRDTGIEPVTSTL